MVTISSHSCVVESHLQFIHSFQQQALCFIVKVFKGGLLIKEEEKINLNSTEHGRIWGLKIKGKK